MVFLYDTPLPPKLQLIMCKAQRLTPLITHCELRITHFALLIIKREKFEVDVDKIQRVVCFILAVVLIIALGNLIYRDIGNLLTVLYCLTLVMAIIGIIDDDDEFN